MSGRTTSCWRGVPMPQMRTNKPQKTKSHEAQAHQQTALSNPGPHTLSPKPSTRSAKTLNPTRSNLETQHPRPSMHAETLYHTNSKTHHIDAAWCLETAKGFGRRTRLRQGARLAQRVQSVCWRRSGLACGLHHSRRQLPRAPGPSSTLHTTPHKTLPACDPGTVRQRTHGPTDRKAHV